MYAEEEEGFALLLSHLVRVGSAVNKRHLQGGAARRGHGQRAGLVLPIGAKTATLVGGQQGTHAVHARSPSGIVQGGGSVLRLMHRVGSGLEQQGDQLSRTGIHRHVQHAAPVGQHRLRLGSGSHQQLRDISLFARHGQRQQISLGGVGGKGFGIHPGREGFLHGGGVPGFDLRRELNFQPTLVESHGEHLFHATLRGQIHGGLAGLVGATHIRSPGQQGFDSSAMPCHRGEYKGGVALLIKLVDIEPLGQARCNHVCIARYGSFMQRKDTVAALQGCSFVRFGSFFFRRRAFVCGRRRRHHSGQQEE